MKTFSIQPGPVSPSVSSGNQPGARGDHQHVVPDAIPAGQQDLVLVQINAVHGGLPERDAGTELTVPRTGQAARPALPNGTNSRPGW